MTFIADPLVERVIGCAIAVHRELGPGLLEAIYLRCLCIELEANGIPFRTQVVVPLVYRHIRIDCGHRIDLLVDGWLVVRGEGRTGARSGSYRPGIDVRGVGERATGSAVQFQRGSSEGRS